MSVFPDQLLPSALDLWALADALDRLHLAVADYNRFLGGQPAVTILESDRPKAALRQLLDAIDDLWWRHIEESDPSEVIGWLTPEICLQLSDDLRESQDLVYELMSTFSASLGFSLGEGRLEIFVEERERRELPENPLLFDDTYTVETLKPRFAMWWHVPDEADRLARRIQERHRLNAWDWDVAQIRLQRRPLLGKEFLQSLSERVMLFDNQEDPPSLAELMGPEFVLRVQQRRESEQPPVDYFESVDGEDWPFVVLPESFTWPELRYKDDPDCLRDYVDRIRERWFLDYYDDGVQHQRFAVPVSELPYGFWSEDTTQRMGGQAFAPHLVEEPEREWRGPYPLDYYDDPFNRAREISIQHGLSPADGENPLWLIQQFDEFTAGRDPASEVTFQVYMLRKHPRRIRLILSGEPEHEGNEQSEQQGEIDCFALQVEKIQEEIGDLSHLSKSPCWPASASPAVCNLLHEFASRELGQSEVPVIWQWLQTEYGMPYSLEDFQTNLQTYRAEKSALAESWAASRSKIKQWPRFPWQRENKETVEAHWTWQHVLEDWVPGYLAWPIQPDWDDVRHVLLGLPFNFANKEINELSIIDVVDYLKRGARQPDAETAAQEKAPATVASDSEGMFTARQLAAKHHVPDGQFANFDRTLRNWAGRNPDRKDIDWIHNEARETTSPKYLFRESAVMEIIERYAGHSLSNDG